MASRMINLSRPVLIIGYGGGAPKSQKQQQTISQMIQSLRGKKGTISVPNGTYDEKIVLPDGVSLLAGNDSFVKITKEILCEGEGSIIGIDCPKFIISGKRILEKCTIEELILLQNSFIEGRHIYANKILCSGGQFILVNSNVGKLPTYNYSIIMNGGIGIIETSTIEGSSQINRESVLECKHTSIVGTNDLFETEDETSTLQLFNCNVTGNGLIKSGAGTSIRGNVISLGDAILFDGGENIKIENI